MQLLRRRSQVVNLLLSGRVFHRQSGPRVGKEKLYVGISE
jgi:hypothetical protein